MEHPPKQGLKQEVELGGGWQPHGFNGTSTKTRIETKTKKKSKTS